MKKIKSYSDLLKLIAKNVKKIRRQNNLTQEDMTEFGFNYRFYQKIESGKHSINLQTLYHLAVAFKVDVVAFFED